MTNEQLYVLVGLPVLFNSLLFTALLVMMQRGFSGVDKRIDELRDEMKSGFAAVHKRLDELTVRVTRVEDRLFDQLPRPLIRPEQEN